MFRSFEVTSHSLHINVSAKSPLTRSFEIVTGQQVVGAIRLAHALARLATIQC